MVPWEVSVVLGGDRIVCRHHAACRHREIVDPEDHRFAGDLQIAALGPAAVAPLVVDRLGVHEAGVARGPAAALVGAPAEAVVREQAPALASL